MISCRFEDSSKDAFLRHVTTDAIVTRGDEILLAKRANHMTKAAGKYALPGGFLDRDETTREGILREVKEETGYSGEVASLFMIRDDIERGDDRQNIMFVFIVDCKEKVGEPDHETAELRWCTETDLPEPSEMAFDHLDVIKKYFTYLKEKHPLPIL